MQTQTAQDVLKGIHENDEVKVEKKIIKSTIAQAEKADKKDKANREPASKSLFNNK